MVAESDISGGRANVICFYLGALEPAATCLIILHRINVVQHFQSAILSKLHGASCASLNPTFSYVY